MMEKIEMDLGKYDTALLNTTSESKELTLPQRVAVALGTVKVEKELVELSKKYADITEIKNLDGRTQCHSAYMTLKTTRTSIQAAAKDARDDATKFSKAVIAEENRLIGITSKEEVRLQKLRDDWDAEQEAKRQAAITAERNRIANIKSEIETIKRYPVDAAGKTSAEIVLMQSSLAQIVTDDAFAEFKDEAIQAHALSTLKLNELHAAAVKHEADVARMQAEREELARLRAENEARAAEQARQAKAEQEAAEKKAKEELEAAQAQLAAERALLEKQKADVEQAHAKLLVEQAAIAETERKASDRLDAAIEQNMKDALAGQPMMMPPGHHYHDAQKPASSPAAIVTAIAPRETPTTAPTLTLGKISERLGFSLTAEFLRSLGYEPANSKGTAKLYHEDQWEFICEDLMAHIKLARVTHKKAA